MSKDNIDSGANREKLTKLWADYGNEIFEKFIEDNILEGALLCRDLGIFTHGKFKGGNTLLCIEAAKNSREMAEFLIDHGTDVNIYHDGWTPLQWAAKFNSQETVKLLIDRGADISAKDNTGQTSLHHAVREKFIETAQLLIDCGADIHAKDDSGQTPLHIAAKYGRKEIAQMLIGQGADIRAKNNAGQTPLDIAVSNKAKEVASNESKETVILLKKYERKQK